MEDWGAQRMVNSAISNCSIATTFLKAGAIKQIYKSIGQMYISCIVFMFHHVNLES